MFKKEKFDYNSYHQQHAPNEPEEGEIVDEYEVISSDEEFSMRERIRELEAKNQEIEQIAVISRTYANEYNYNNNYYHHTQEATTAAANHHYTQIPPISRYNTNNNLDFSNHYDIDRAAQIPTDASSISSTEFQTPKKRKRHKSKECKRRHNHHHHHHHHHNKRHHKLEFMDAVGHSMAEGHSKKTGCRKRQNLYVKKSSTCQRHQHHRSQRATTATMDTFSMDSMDSILSNAQSESDSQDDNLKEFLERSNQRKYSMNLYDNRQIDYIDRNTLRLAVSRNSTNLHRTAKKNMCLKDKLLMPKELEAATEIKAETYGGDIDADEDDDDDDDVEIIEIENLPTIIDDSSSAAEDSTDSLEEKELRLIALKSAVMKKHMARKKRNAEAAYSPTDFDSMLLKSSAGILKTDELQIDDIDVVDLEECEEEEEEEEETALETAQNDCVISSPEASPNLMLEDSQPVDMDIANSDSEGAWSKQKDDEQMPIKNDILTFAAYPPPPPPNDFSGQFAYGLYMPSNIPLPPPVPPPPPPGVDDYDQFGELIPPAPNIFDLQNTVAQDMDLDNESSLGAALSVERNVTLLNEAMDLVEEMDEMERCRSVDSKQMEYIKIELGEEELLEDSISMETVKLKQEEDLVEQEIQQEIQINNNEKQPAHEDEEEEEEEALRALLLAKFQSPKYQKRKLTDQQETAMPKTEQACMLNTEQACNTVLDSEKQQQDNLKPELILKEAVKRLKTHHQPSEIDEIKPLLQQSTTNDDFPLNFIDECSSSSSINDISKMYLNPLCLQMEPVNTTASSGTREHLTPSPVTLEILRKKLLLLKDIKQNTCSSVAEVRQETFKQNTCSSVAEVKQNPNNFVNEQLSQTAELNTKSNVDDIITQRLQKIKDTVFNATTVPEIKNTEEQQIEKEALQQNNSNLPKTNTNKQKQVESQTNTFQSNNNMTIAAAEATVLTPATKPTQKKPARKIAAKKKVIKVNVDSAKNLSTLKVTIPNTNIQNNLSDNADNASAKSCENDVKSKENNISAKRNIKLQQETQNKLKTVANNQPEMANKKVLGNKLQTTNRVVKKQVTSLTAATVTVKSNSSLPIKPKALKPLSAISSAQKSYSVLKATTAAAAAATTAIQSSALTTTTTTKIVKPNKVINKTVNLKSSNITTKATVTTTTTTTTTKTKTAKVAVATKQSPATTTTNNSTPKDNSRLITSLEQVKHMCRVPQFIISLNNTPNQSSDEDEDWLNDCDTMFKPLYDYNDNASPLSLTLESPCRTPIRSNSPIEIASTSSSTQTKSVLKQKLDNCLKLIDKKLQSDAKTIEKRLTVETERKGQTVATPLAVRHLPAAAQNEYRQLINRMKMLENKRKLSASEDNSENKDSAEIESDKQQQSNSDDATVAATADNNMPNNVALAKKSLVKQVLIKNANNTSNLPESKQTATTKVAPHKPCKSSVLRSYENLYGKIGSGIVNHLEKSLKLVEQAKHAKMSKLKLEKRLKELKAEMDILQSKYKTEEEKISRIFPSIRNSNEVITNMKQKRSKVFKAAMTLGKTLKGDEYRLNNELKQNITAKSKILAEEIKFVNSLTLKDIDKFMEKELSRNSIIAVKNNNGLPETKNDDDDVVCVIKPSENTKEVLNDEVSSGDRPANNTACSKSEPTAKDDVEIEDEENSHSKENSKDGVNTSDAISNNNFGGNTEVSTDDLPQSSQFNAALPEQQDADMLDEKEEEENKSEVKPDVIQAQKDEESLDNKILALYQSPLEHLRNRDCNMDPNAVLCPYDLMGNCEDPSCKYVHLTSNEIQENIHNTEPEV